MQCNDPIRALARSGAITSTASRACRFSGHRYYDPAYARFLNQDPIGFGGGINVYSYAGNNPVNGIDPSGFNGADGELAKADWIAAHGSQFTPSPLWTLPPLVGMAYTNAGPGSTKSLYPLFDGNDNFLKWGRSIDPLRRYTASVLDGYGQAWPRSLMTGSCEDITEIGNHR